MEEPMGDLSAEKGEKLFHLLISRQVLTKEEAEAAIYALLDISVSVEKVYRIGVLETRSAVLNAANMDAFRQGMLESLKVQSCSE